MSEALEQWPGMQTDQDAVGAGCSWVQNPRWWIAGEMQRRHGLSKLAAIGSTANVNAARFWNPLTGYVAVFATSAGTIETASA